MMVMPAALQQLLGLLHRRLLLRAALTTVAGSAVVLGIARGLPEPAFLTLTGFGALLILLGQVALDRPWRTDPEGLARHLDRCFPCLEESTALLLSDPAELPMLQRLQRQRVESRWPQVLTAPDRWLPPLQWRPALLLTLLGLSLWLLSPGLTTFSSSDSLTVAGDHSPATGDALSSVPQLSYVHIKPPAYTGLPDYVVTEYDLEVPEGSLVTWHFEGWQGPPLQLAIGTSEADLELVPLVKGSDQQWFASTTLAQTALYRLQRKTSEGFESFEGIHTLRVILDAPPRVRIVEPRGTSIERAGESPEAVNYHVEVVDDYGVRDAIIYASVAKGSGEGVKFRDQQFAFDRAIDEGDRQLFERHWTLDSLAMEPGDEAYFFTLVTDNRPGVPNEGRSDTLVVRWLEERRTETVSEGIAISVMPEYFKSQRQIIIDTEQLILDRERLAPEVFQQLSRELGEDQARLKERYGQYLGDEFAEGSPLASSGATDAGEQDLEDGDVDAHDEEHSPDGGHAHELEPAAGKGVSREGLIALFSHDHGASEIGPITRESPVGLMKRSISYMWQAELQLRLAEPEAALPYERDALKYFDLARQAERIFTRRLGFEPPPVTEERRLTGELDDVRSRHRRSDARPDPEPTQLLRRLYRLLSTTSPGADLDSEQLDLLGRSGEHLTLRAQDRPALISIAADLERIRARGNLTLACEGCLAELRAVVWSLLPAVEPDPTVGDRVPIDDQAVDYLGRQQLFNGQHFDGATPGSSQGGGR